MHLKYFAAFDPCQLQKCKMFSYTRATVGVSSALETLSFCLARVFLVNIQKTLALNVAYLFIYENF